MMPSFFSLYVKCTRESANTVYIKAKDNPPPLGGGACWEAIHEFVFN